jgi:serine/threonine-protein kinase
LGAVGYFLLTGRPVFEGKSVVEICAHHLHTPPVPPSQRVPGIAKDLEALLLRCLEKDPSRRPVSADALRRELQTLQGASAWDEEDAAAWWRTYHDEKGRISGRPAAQESSPFLTSLPVDLSARALRAVG